MENTSNTYAHVLIGLTIGLLIGTCVGYFVGTWQTLEEHQALENSKPVEVQKTEGVQDATPNNPLKDLQLNPFK